MALSSPRTPPHLRGPRIREPCPRSQLDLSPLILALGYIVHCISLVSSLCSCSNSSRSVSRQQHKSKMSGWKYALSLTKEQVAEAEPPGTVKLIGRTRCPIEMLLLLNTTQNMILFGRGQGETSKRIMFNSYRHQRATLAIR